MMKKVMKTLLALAMAFVCGGAWALTPKADAVFTSFTDGATVKGSLSGAMYTLSIGSGNSVNSDGQIEIGTGSQVGAKITADRALGTKMTILVKYAAMPVTDSAVVSIFEDNDAGNGKCYPGARWRSGTATDLVGFYEDNQERTYYFSSGGGGADNSSPDPQTGAGYLLFSYDLGAGTGCYAGSSLNSLAGGYLTGLKFGSRKNYGFAVGGPYTDSYYPACAGMKIEKIAVFLGQYHTGTSVTNYAQFDWPSEVGDNKSWSSFGETGTKVNYYTKNTATLNLPASAGVPAGTKVAVSAIKFATPAANHFQDTITIDGKTSDTKETVDFPASKGGDTTYNKVVIYKFTTNPLVVEVGSNYTITIPNANNVDGNRFSTIATPTASPINIGISNTQAFAAVDGTIQSFPTLPNTIAYTTGDPDDWQSTGVAVAQADEIAVLKELANRYSFAATFGSTSMDASPRDGTPLNVTLHSDGVLTVEMQVTNGGYKKAALVGFTVDGGFLKVKRIKSAYANTSFNGPMMTYANGNVTKASGVNDGSYILANVTLTRITKFKGDAVEPDFLSTTAPSIRYDASKYDNFTYNENGEVQSWKDLSANNNNATPAEAKSGNTMVTRYGRVEIVNGVPAFQMGNVGSGIDLGFTRQTDIRTVFWVMDIKQDYGAFFLGDSTSNCYDFHRGQNGIYASENKPFKNARNVRCDGATVNQSSDVVPTGLHVYSAKLASNASANRLSQDRDINNRNGGRAISELVIFNSELTDDQIAAMNKYLMKKWMGIETGEVSATLSEGSQNFSTITWDEGGEFANGKDVTLTVNATTTLTIDNETLIGSLTLTGAGTLTVNSAQNLTFGEIDISGFTGTINYNVDATRASFTADNALKTFIKNAANKVVFTFTGSGSNGATVDFGGNELNSNPDIGGRLIFSGGTHTLQICHGNVDSGKGTLATNGTIDAPSILATNNATLTYKMKDMCGWNGEFDAGSTVKVDSGSKIKLSHNQNNDTMFMRGRIVVVPGGELEIDPTSNDNVLAIYGGNQASTDHTNAQIYVPAPAQGAANTVAKITVASGVTRTPIKFRGASAITVEEGATLDISASVKGTEAITKYGDGILRMPNRSDYTGMITVIAGYLDVGEMRDFSSLSGITMSGTGGFLIHETSAEYAKADLTVTNPNNYTIKVIRPNGPTVYDLATVVDDTTIKISGAATSFDVTFNTKDTGTLNGHIDYQCLDYVRLQYDSTPSYTNETQTAGSKDMGVYLKHHPYVHYLENNDDAWFKSTDEITLAVVGQMPSTQNTVFLHMGRSVTKNGLFLATGTNETQVVIGYNKQNTLAVIDTLDVPNASTARHAYIITKHDDPEGTVNRQTTFDIWLDGEMINTKKFDHFTVTGGIQVGKPYGSNFSGWNNVGDSDSTSYINLIRVYDRVISEAEILKYSDSAEYPYNSPQGTYQRNFTTDAGQKWKGADNAWTSSVEGEESGVALPLKGLVTANFAGAATITVNQTEATSYEKLILNGASNGESTITFQNGEGAVAPVRALNSTINTPIVIKGGVVDLSGGPTKISTHGHVTFDYSSLTAQDVLTDDDGAVSFKVTGLTQATADQFTLIKPTDARLDVSLVKHNDNNSYYVEATVKPVYLRYENSAYSYVLANGTAVETLLEGDTIYIEDGETKYKGDIWHVGEYATMPNMTPYTLKLNSGMNFKSAFVANQKVELASGISVFLYGDIGDNVSIGGSGTLFPGYKTNGSSVGDGTVFNCPVEISAHALSKGIVINGAVTMTNSLTFAANSTALIKLGASSATLTLPTAVATGKVVSGVNGSSVKQETNAQSKIVYSLVDTSDEPIAPSDDPAAPAVVIEDVGTGIAVEPGAKVVIPTGTDTSKVTVKYGETTLTGGEHPLVTVTVNQTTGAIELTTTDSAKPAETAIAMATPTEGEGESATDQVQFTITNPIPGLFYEIVSGDSFDEHGALVVDHDAEKGTSQATTSAEAKTVSIPMTFTDGKKVKYYKVSVKATK